MSSWVGHKHSSGLVEVLHSGLGTDQAAGACCSRHIHFSIKPWLLTPWFLQRCSVMGSTPWQGAAWALEAQRKAQVPRVL